MTHTVPDAQDGTTRRAAVTGAASLIGLALGTRAATAETVSLPFGNGERPIVPAGTFPQKGEMILQRTRPPLLETPFDVFRNHIFTPNDRTFVRWHMSDFPSGIDPSTYRIRVGGAVRRPFQITLEQLIRDFPQRRMATVNQCAGNSRGFVDPRVPGVQWGHGAMSNAVWTGVPLSHLLARAGLSPKATWVAFRSIEKVGGMYPASVAFEKALPVRRANDGAVMIAFRMNGAYLPLLNGYPVRLVVPGWYSTYWVKMLTEIEVLEHPSTSFWMAQAYRIPDTPSGTTRPDRTGIGMVPVNAMKPRSFFSSVTDGSRLPAAGMVGIRGFAFGGGSALKAVLLSIDGGRSWRTATLGEDYGSYGFRSWYAPVQFPKPGNYRLMVRAMNVIREMQPLQAGWNAGGYLYNPVEHADVVVG